ncbi:MAG: M36 family metallopeptidase [Bacteroidia bacterium]|nr:M36 family metallopeptidase [Bacteroidia bacterium]
MGKSIYPLHKISILGFCLFICLFPIQKVISQEKGLEIVNSHVQNLKIKPFTKEDFQHWTLSSNHTTSHNGVSHYYLQQNCNGIPVYLAIMNLAIKDGRVRAMGNRFIPHVNQRFNTDKPSISEEEAINFACKHLGIAIKEGLVQISSEKGGKKVFSKGKFSFEDIPVKLVYFPMADSSLKLCWDLSIYPKNGHHWWSMRIDASNGQVLDKVSWTLECKLPTHLHGKQGSGIPPHHHFKENFSSHATGNYRVFNYRVESPNFGSRSLEINPSDSLASPFGWHDTNGILGAEFTDTRGNNVDAYADLNGNNTPAFRPDGGINLVFDYPLDLNIPIDSLTNTDAAVTNLFYNSNILHDLLYYYGFTEAAGNFQRNNYNRGGLGNDEVLTEAQDGLSLNNAIFSSPPDGFNPRMQMFPFLPNLRGNYLHITSPNSVARSYEAVPAIFSPRPAASPILGKVVLAEDTVGLPYDGCESPINLNEIAGNFVLLDLVGCPPTEKILEMQNAGAAAVLYYLPISRPPFPLGGNPASPVTIPSLMIAKEDADSLLIVLMAGDSIFASLSDPFMGAPKPLIASDYANGVIAHEYGHGVSTRLTGGRLNATCLRNDEQMGEGWSDFFYLYMSLDTAIKNRGIGTYILDQNPIGPGVRERKYSQDTAINEYTYASTNDPMLTTKPHGIGMVWANMLWEMTFDLIDVYGYDPDLYTGTGGNNIALQLIMDGLSLQPCQPGFVDGRDAILMADSLNNGGANQCLIWQAFARRGLGLSANQGSPTNRSDQIEAFDLPASCIIPVAPPIASFGFQIEDSCSLKIQFLDQSDSIPTNWSWSFGDGTTDSVADPLHSFPSSGTYQVRLVVSNPLGSDTISQQITISLPAGPQLTDQEICLGDSIQFSLPANGNYTWTSTTGDTLANTPTFSIPQINRDTSFLVSQFIQGIMAQLGPADSSFGPGSYPPNRSRDFGGTNFEAFRPFTLVSAWIHADTVGSWSIILRDAYSGGGNIIGNASFSINQVGGQRVQLSLRIPGPGQYSISGNLYGLYRNDQGSYPYFLQGVASISSGYGSIGSGPYYSFYDWELSEPDCQTDFSVANVRVVDPSFTFSPQTASGEVSFSNSTNNGQTWLWDFGDGNTANSQNPIHTYHATGTYLVSLSVNGLCVFQDSIQIVSLARPIADFGSQISSSCSSVLTFTDSSVQLPESWIWDFGDGNMDSAQNPVHRYEESGSYPVTLIVSNGQGADTIQKIVKVNLPAGPVLADEIICEGDSINLTASGSGTYIWFDVVGDTLFRGSTFGTGSLFKDSSYFIREVFLNSMGEIECFSELVEVKVEVSIADFSFLEVNPPGTVEFTDLSKDAISWLWDFGDGNTSTLRDPIHFYNSIGNYEVRLRINGRCTHKDTIAVTLLNNEALLAIPAFRLIPNPTQGKCELVFGKPTVEKFQARILNLSGQVVNEMSLAAGLQSYTLELENLSPGIYFLEVQSSKSRQGIKFIISE